MTPTFILTTGHTGSSVFTKMLGVMGAWLGDCYVGEDGKEFYENKRLLAYNRTLLDDDALAYKPFDQAEAFKLHTAATPAGEALRAELRRYLLQEVPAGVVPVFKDPRTSVTWPVWKAVFPEARWVFLHRKLEEVTVGVNDEQVEAFKFRSMSLRRASGVLPFNKTAYAFYPEITSYSLAYLALVLGLDAGKAGEAFKLWNPR